MKAVFVFMVSFFCQFGWSQQAQENGQDVPVAVPASELIQNINDLLPASDPHRWYFLECVEDDHDCQHHAARAGYHHYYSVHDSQTCHHDHHAEHACYVR